MSSSHQKPKIACLPNGPYYLLYDLDPAPVPYLRKWNGESCTNIKGAALCRCGGSRNKPFCDGTHGTNGFSDHKIADGSANRRTSYKGRGITIHDNRGICAHAGFCTEHLKSVFRMDKEPWIDPDGAAAEEIIRVVRMCPSGALRYSVGGIDRRDEEKDPMVTATRNGPYAVVGGIELIGEEFGEGASRDRYTLCRCGASKNKPFCDGSHWSVGFSPDE